MSTFKHYFSVFTCYMRLALQEQLEYPTYIFAWFITVPIHFASGLWMLNILVDRFQPLNGWEFPELTFLYGLGILSHGIMIVICIQSWHIDWYVVNGEFDRMLLRPMNVFFQYIVSYLNLIGLSDLLMGTIIFTYGCKLVGFVWSFENTLKIIIVLLSGAIIRSAVYTFTGSIAFWTKRSGSLVDLNLTVLERSTIYPLSIYPYIVQVVLTFVIPLGFITFYPVCGFLGKDTGFSLPLDLTIWSPIVAIVMFTLVQVFFNKGLKRYESAGS